MRSAHAMMLVGAGTALAAPLTSDVTAKPRVAKFDNIPEQTHLSYTGFGVGQPVSLATNIQPSSSKGLIFAPYLLQDTLQTPEISVNHFGSKTVSFDFESIASGCYLATENGALAPAIECTIRYTGTKRNGGEVSFDFDFDPKGAELLGVALGKEKVQKAKAPKRFSDLVSLRPTVITALGLPAVQGATAQMAFDDFAYTAYVQK